MNDWIDVVRRESIEVAWILKAIFEFYEISLQSLRKATEIGSEGALATVREVQNHQEFASH